MKLNQGVSTHPSSMEATVVGTIVVAGTGESMAKYHRMMRWSLLLSLAMSDVVGIMSRVMFSRLTQSNACVTSVDS